MAEIIFKNFKGINLDEGNWQNSYASYTTGLDLFGLANNSGLISYPGVLQGMLRVSAGAKASGVSAVTEVVTGFANYKSQDFAIGAAATNGRIYRRDGGTWTWVSAGAAGLTVSAANGDAANLEVYGGNMYYAQQAYLGQYDNTTGNANFQTLTNSDTNPRPMKVFSGSLFVGNTNVVAKYDGTTFTASALTLPTDFVIQSMEVFEDRIFIMADNNYYSRLFIWDGVSNTYQTFADLYDEISAPSLKVVNGTLFAVANRGVATPGTPIYQFNGTEFIKIQILPIQRSVTGGLGVYSGGLLIASDDDSTALYEDGVAGVWMIYKHSSDYPYNAVLAFPLRERLTNFTIGAITNSYIGARDITNASFEIFEIQGSNANTSNNIWQTLPIDAGSTNEKMWHGVKLNFDTLNSTKTVIVKYRLNDTSAWTTLKTLTSSTDNALFIPLNRSSRTIGLRIELTSSSSNTTRLHSIVLHYSPTTK